MSVEELLSLEEKVLKKKFIELMQKQPPTEFNPEHMAETAYEIFKAGYNANETPSGNQYQGYLKEGNETLRKVHPNEPIFVLRAQDNTAPGIILSWIAKNLDTVEEGKLKEAFQTVLAMRRYDSRRDPT